MTEHTPGPWAVEFSTEWPFDISIQPDILTVRRIAHSSSQKTIEDCRNAVGFDYAERDSVAAMIATQEANAHIIAASPDLLAVAESVVAWADHQALLFGTHEASLVVAAARAAIAKAKGVTL